ncbi:uncharacterized protein PgNI_09080 [Pyricularia grisea]|uniref:Phosphodiester glycosidase domain-containing protein n=1 Tax=Pyricularia grisea TaxID=148305 RepID=A0A6P8ATN9_PYRGI|nr:uncharacterized protein PgNI_09080 [Pyricularia grisea]TLD05499.1 hypothetical protein PgNI_09080 [Pyricularia grisea]
MQLPVSILAFGTFFALALPTPPPLRSQYLTTELPGSQATLHQFYKEETWKSDVADIPSTHAIFNGMKEKDTFTAIVMPNSKTSIRGPAGAPGTLRQTPLDYVKNAATPNDNFIFTNGGFFINSPASEKYGYSIGPLLHKETKPENIRTEKIPAQYAKDYKKLVGDDGTYLWSGPQLKEWTRKIEHEARFQYWDNKPDPKTTKTPKTAFTRIPGNLAHSSQRNERLALVEATYQRAGKPVAVKIVFAYTTNDRHRGGVTIFELRELIQKFLMQFIDGLTLERTELAMNLDGGGSVFVGLQSRGTTYAIVGGSQKDTPVRLGLRSPGELKYAVRAVTNFVRHDLAPSPAGDTAGKSRSPSPGGRSPSTGGSRSPSSGSAVRGRGTGTPARSGRRR